MGKDFMSDMDTRLLSFLVTSRLYVRDACRSLPSSLRRVMSLVSSLRSSSRSTPDERSEDGEWNEKRR